MIFPSAFAHTLVSPRAHTHTHSQLQQVPARHQLHQLPVLQPRRDCVQPGALLQEGAPQDVYQPGVCVCGCVWVWLFVCFGRYFALWRFEAALKNANSRPGRFNGKHQKMSCYIGITECKPHTPFLVGSSGEPENHSETRADMGQPLKSVQRRKSKLESVNAKWNDPNVQNPHKSQKPGLAKEVQARLPCQQVAVWQPQPAALQRALVLHSSLPR